MEIMINDHRKIFAVQQEFASMFPFLKIEFKAKPKKEGAQPSKRFIKHSSKTIGQCRLLHNSGTITISAQMTVADLKENLSDVYGLFISIFRSSGKVWLEISQTNSWTLEQQNKMGEELSQSKK